MNTSLRDWQMSALQKAEAVFRRDRRFLLVATPGAGKTVFTLTLAVRLIREGAIDHVHIVVPTRALRRHWQNEGQKFGLQLGRRSNARLRCGELPFDVSGVVTTFAQVAAEPDAHLAAVENKKALVVIEEAHHAGDRRAWGEAIQDAFGGAARFILSLSGTPFRHDDCAISFLTYNPSGVTVPDHEYTYPQAIADNVCRPAIFRSYTALIEYQARGETFQFSFSDDLPAQHLSETLRHALHPDAGLIANMVRDADDELSAIRARGPRWSDAAGLLVAMSQGHALACAEVVRRVTGEEPTVVISDSETAEEDLDAFKGGMGRWIIAVRMVSEGVDIPRLMVAVYATNIVSSLFVRQLVGRVLRVRHKGHEEVASVFMPGERRLMKEVTTIEAEVSQFLKDAAPGQFAAVRAAIGRTTRAMTEVAPTVSNIDGSGCVFRGETLSQVELDHAETVRDVFPLGDRLSAAQIAWSLRRLKPAAE